MFLVITCFIPKTQKLCNCCILKQFNSSFAKAINYSIFTASISLFIELFGGNTFMDTTLRKILLRKA